MKLLRSACSPDTLNFCAPHHISVFYYAPIDLHYMSKDVARKIVPKQQFLKVTERLIDAMDRNLYFVNIVIVRFMYHKGRCKFIYWF